MRFGLSNNNNNNNNNEKNKKLAMDINQFFSQDMQQQIFKAIKEYKNGHLILFTGMHKPQFPAEKAGLVKVLDYMLENGTENTPEIKPWRTFAGFVCLLMREYEGSVINADEYKQDAQDVTYSLVVGVKEKYVAIFMQKWDTFYASGNFNAEYLEELALQSQIASASNSSTNPNMNP